MKKYNLLLVIMGLIMFCSCDKLLTTPPLDKIDEDAWFSSKEQVAMMVANCYNKTWGESDVPYRDCFTDNATNRNGGEKSIGNGSYDSQNGTVKSFWQYEDIAHLNYVLEGIEKAKSFLSDEDYKQFSAQVRFIRAFVYFDMMTLFGDVPLIKKTLTVTESKETSRQPRAEVLQFILDELEKGVLVDIAVGESKEKGRVNKSVVEAFLSRIYLFEKNYPKTLEYTKKVMSGNYSLYSNYDKLFRPQSDKDATNKEIIFERQYTYPLKGHSLNLTLSYVSGVYNGWSWCLPLQNLADEYECINGHSMSDCKRLGCEYYQKRIDEQTDTKRGEYLYRDPRFHATIMYPFWEWITSSGKVISTFGVDDP
ncbi:MAG: RagB/SusD family nutrient uptake outer membrane protein, partial [Rikenellaceae bacterium]